MFKNKKETVKYYKTTADQVAGKAEMRNRNISLVTSGNNVLVTEESDFYVLMDKSWTFYGQARISTLFCKSTNKWKISQQHGSIPDARTGGGEQLNTDKIKEENFRLKDAIKRRTIELENKNRELEIEASLEKVRAVAMGMNKPDDLLNICEVLYKEFHSFGFSELRNAMINIHNDEKGTFLNYDYSDEIGKSINHLEYNIHPVIKKQIKQIRSADDAFSETVFKGEDLKSWKAFRKKIGEKDDPRINNSTALYYYFYSIGIGSIGISTFNSIDKEKLEVLKRFRNVFKLSYQRYKDIEQAEAQAREAQIEASLERVRAVAMSMNKSDDLLSICEISFKEFQKLGFNDLRNTIIHILNDEKGFFVDYDFSDTMDGSITSIYYNSHPVVENYLKQIKSAEDVFAKVVLEGDQLNDWKEFRRKAGQRDDPRLESIPALHYYFYSIGVGDIGISTFKPIDESQINILKRFRNVFDLAYRRYIDINEAEAQAREAQIEVTLERVRSRTMAMHKSEELSDVISVVSDQLQQLKIRFDHVSFAINSDAEDYHFWTSLYGKPHPYELKVPYLDNPIANRAKEVRAKGLKFYQDTLTPEENREWLEHAFKHNPADYLSPEEKAYVLSRGFSRSFAMMPNIILAVGNYASKPYSEDENQIIKRFAAVFEQSYTRFLDLQKAETQNKIIQAENDRKTQELEAARQLQLSMLPKDLPNLPNLDIAVYMQTATEVGGDYYDFQVGLDGTLITVIGDATGHGMKAGTMVTAAKSLFNTHAANPDILFTFNEITRCIKKMQIHMLSMCLTILKIQGNNVIMSAAGMPPALIYRKQDMAVEEIVLKGMPLGAVSNFPYKLKNTTINSGDTILLSSDGLPELFNKDKEMFSYERVVQEFSKNAHKSPEEIIEELKTAGSNWIDNGEPDDDVTFVVIKVK